MLPPDLENLPKTELLALIRRLEGQLQGAEEEPAGREIRADRSYIEGDASADGDFVSGDQIKQLGEITNKYGINMGDVISFLDRSAESVDEYRRYHDRLQEWKELHHALNNILIALGPYSAAVKRLAGRASPARALPELVSNWSAVDIAVNTLVEVSRNLKQLKTADFRGDRRTGMQGAPWAVEIRVGLEEIERHHGDAERSSPWSWLANRQWWAQHERMTESFQKIAMKHMSSTDTRLRMAARELATHLPKYVGRSSR